MSFNGKDDTSTKSSDESSKMVNSSRSPSPQSSSTASSTVLTEGGNEAALLRPLSVFSGGEQSDSIGFKNWQARILDNLEAMTKAGCSESFKMHYVMDMTGCGPHNKLAERFAEAKAKGSASFGGARPMVMFLSQYYDDDIRMTDIRFGSVCACRVT